MTYTFIDADLSFRKHPGSNDITKKYEVEAVRQAIRNIFFTNKYEKPFNQNFGLGIKQFLFENASPIFTVIVKRKIMEQLTEYEPRATIDDLQVNLTPDSNTASITLSFHVIGNPAPQKITMVLERTR